mgnify:CR=1 FL=1
MDNIDWQHLLFQFDGRINRGKYWLGIAAIWVALIAAGVLYGVLGEGLGTAVLAVISLGIIWPGLAIQIKRWQDRGKYGWWIFIGFIPLIGGLWQLIETGFLPGDDGPNEYGPDPLAA